MLASYSTDADSHATKCASDSGTTESIAMAARLCGSSECPGGLGRAEERLGFFFSEGPRERFDSAASKGRWHYLMTVGLKKTYNRWSLPCYRI